jgi:hypothetical protein
MYLLGGLAGTVAITLMMNFVDPLITGRSMDIPRMLGTLLGNPHGAGGLILHLFNGVILFPLGFAFISARLPGPAIVKGLLWGTILWALAQVLIVPRLGSGFFGDTAGGPLAVLSSLAGHLVYGGLQGLIGGSQEEPVGPCTPLEDGDRSSETGSPARSEGDIQRRTAQETK